MWIVVINPKEHQLEYFGPFDDEDRAIKFGCRFGEKDYDWWPKRLWSVEGE